LISVPGFSFTNDAFKERPISWRSNKGRARTILFGTKVVKSSTEGGVAVTVGIAQLPIVKMSEDKSFPSRIKKCSTSGPSDNAGKNVRAPITTTTPTNRPTKSGP